jgi:hypothetical protein
VKKVMRILLRRGFGVQEDAFEQPELHEEKISIFYHSNEIVVLQCGLPSAAA